MARSFTYSALVLRVRPSGESNREAWFLTAEEGILKATVFGGPKSTLRAHIAPFHQGTLWIYYDPVRDSRKVTDFDVQFWRPGIREHYERAKTAGAVLETILASHGGGGNWREALKISCETLDALDNADEQCCMRICLHFLWNWAYLLGLRQDIHHCASCARELQPDEYVLFNNRECTVHCASCVGEYPENNVFPIGAGARKWLTAVEDLHPTMLHRYTLDDASLSQAKTLVIGLMAAALGKRLESWDTRQRV
jgi:DNA repair protein RecO (recombination protein O)